MSRAAEEIEALLSVIAKLRDPQYGCPWDREQNFDSIAPFTIEEAYEVADAIARGDLQCLRDELGDLLFQVVFHARLAEELGKFDFAGVARSIRDKLVRRHPHVFAEPKNIDVPELHTIWEAQKAHERAEQGARGALGDVPRALPALMRAAKLGRRARRVGFDWGNPAGVRSKIDEELAEIDRALKLGSAQQVAEELGDLLFTIANWARHLELDAEDALRGAAFKFERRFESMERQAELRGLVLQQLSPSQWEALWSEAKSAEAKSALGRGQVAE